MSKVLVAVALAGRAAPSAPTGDAARDAFVIDTLAVDNDMWTRREPELVRDKLVKMQREPFLWVRGTAAVFWREAMAPDARDATAFGDVASSRVLLVADPHVENLGSFRAPDGTMSIEWNDFDSAGYGPYELDLRRLVTGLAIAANDTAMPDDPTALDALARAAATGYANRMADLAAGIAPAPLTTGTGTDYTDKLIAKAVKNGDARKALDETAPVGADGMTRAIAFGDLDPVAADGVIETRLEPVGAEAAVWIARAIDVWSGGTARVKLQCRRIGSGVSSYPALRYYVVLEGATPAPDDDQVVELKEERDGVIVRDVPRYASAEWASPGARVVDAQRRLQTRPDTDALLGRADVGALSLRVHDHEAYQRGVDHPDFGGLGADEQRALAAAFGALLATAHGRALTADGVPGHSVIAPLLAGKTAAFADELATFGATDVAEVRADFARLSTRDLAAEVIP